MDTFQKPMKDITQLVVQEKRKVNSIFALVYTSRRNQQKEASNRINSGGGTERKEEKIGEGIKRKGNEI